MLAVEREPKILHELKLQNELHHKRVTGGKFCPDESRRHTFIQLPHHR
jgi:hypothetical protein